MLTHAPSFRRKFLVAPIGPLAEGSESVRCLPPSSKGQRFPQGGNLPVGDAICRQTLNSAVQQRQRRLDITLIQENLPLEPFYPFGPILARFDVANLDRIAGGK